MQENENIYYIHFNVCGGNYHGMTVAHLLGWLDEIPGFEWFEPCITKDDIVLIGFRDLDKEEKANLKNKASNVILCMKK